jgi:hypothetical protein
MKLLKVFTLTLLTILFSCNTEELTVDQERSSNLTVSITQNRADFTGKIKRIRIKKRRVGSGFKVTVIGNPEEAAASIKLQYSTLISQDGDITTNGVYSLINIPFEDETENNIIYRLNETELELGDPVGSLLIILATTLDEEGEPTGESEQFYVHVDNNNRVNTNNIKVTETTEPGAYMISTKITGTSANTVTSAEGELYIEGFGPVPFNLQLIENNNENIVTLASENPVFIDVDNPAQNIIGGKIIPKDGEGVTIEESVMPIIYNQYTGLTLGNTKVNRYGDGIYDIIAVLRGEQLPNVENLFLSLTKEDGETSEVVPMKIKAMHANRTVYTYRGFSEGDSFLIGNQMNIILIAHNGEGNMADYLRAVTITEDEGITFLPPAITYDPISGHVTRRHERIRAAYKQRMRSTEVKVTFPDGNNNATPLDVLLEERENGFIATLANPVFIGAPAPLTYVISETTTYAEDGAITGQAEFEVPVIIDYALTAKPSIINNEDGTHSIKVALRGENKDEGEYVSVQLFGETMEPQEYTLELTQQNETRNVYRLNNIDLGGEEFDPTLTSTNVNFYYRCNGCEHSDIITINIYSSEEHDY